LFTSHVFDPATGIGLRRYCLACRMEECVFFEKPVCGHKL
jgi:hypothetical protein